MARSRRILINEILFTILTGAVALWSGIQLATTTQNSGEWFAFIGTGILFLLGLVLLTIAVRHPE
jgi:hypothetical protein